jgi:hypothetical protein
MHRRPRSAAGPLLAAVLLLLCLGAANCSQAVHGEHQQHQRHQQQLHADLLRDMEAAVADTQAKMESLGSAETRRSLLQDAFSGEDGCGQAEDANSPCVLAGKRARPSNVLFLSLRGLQARMA